MATLTPLNSSWSIKSVLKYVFLSLIIIPSIYLFVDYKIKKNNEFFENSLKEKEIEIFLKDENLISQLIEKLIQNPTFFQQLIKNKEFQKNYFGDNEKTQKLIKEIEENVFLSNKQQSKKLEKIEKNLTIYLEEVLKLQNLIKKNEPLEEITEPEETSSFIPKTDVVSFIDEGQIPEKNLAKKLFSCLFNLLKKKQIEPHQKAELESLLNKNDDPMCRNDSLEISFDLKKNEEKGLVDLNFNQEKELVELKSQQEKLKKELFELNENFSTFKEETNEKIENGMNFLKSKFPQEENEEEKEDNKEKKKFTRRNRRDFSMPVGFQKREPFKKRPSITKTQMKKVIPRRSRVLSSDEFLEKKKITLEKDMNIRKKESSSEESINLEKKSSSEEKALKKKESSSEEKIVKNEEEKIVKNEEETKFVTIINSFLNRYKDEEEKIFEQFRSKVLEQWTKKVLIEIDGETYKLEDFVKKLQKEHKKEIEEIKKNFSFNLDFFKERIENFEKESTFLLEKLKKEIESGEKDLEKAVMKTDIKECLKKIEELENKEKNELTNKEKNELTNKEKNELENKKKEREINEKKFKELEIQLEETKKKFTFLIGSIEEVIRINELNKTREKDIFNKIKEIDEKFQIYEDILEKLKKEQMEKDKKLEIINTETRIRSSILKTPTKPLKTNFSLKVKTSEKKPTSRVISLMQNISQELNQTQTSEKSKTKPKEELKNNEKTKKNEEGNIKTSEEKEGFYQKEKEENLRNEKEDIRIDLEEIKEDINDMKSKLEELKKNKEIEENDRRSKSEELKRIEEIQLNSSALFAEMKENFNQTKRELSEAEDSRKRATETYQKLAKDISTTNTKVNFQSLTLKQEEIQINELIKKEEGILEKIGNFFSEKEKLFNSLIKKKEEEVNQVYLREKNSFQADINKLQKDIQEQIKNLIHSFDRDKNQLIQSYAKDIGENIDYLKSIEKKVGSIYDQIEKNKTEIFKEIKDHLTILEESKNETLNVIQNKNKEIDSLMNFFLSQKQEIDENISNLKEIININSTIKERNFLENIIKLLDFFSKIKNLDTFLQHLSKIE